MSSTLYRLIIVLAKLLRAVGIVVVIFLLINFAVNFVDNPHQYPILMKLTQTTKQLSAPIIAQIKMTIPYNFNGTDYSSIILVAIIFLFLNLFANFSARAERKLAQHREKKRYQEWRSKIKQTLPAETVKEMDSKFAEAMTQTNYVDRKKLLKEFAALKTKLDSMGEHLAFLSIDVVDSTGMKRDEDKYLASYDFDRYNGLAIACMKEFNVHKYTMTPDGLMCCFNEVDEAFNAAKCLLEKLKDFNLHQKKIKRDFHIRCGINGGLVFIDEETPLEQVSDRTIDIAGHMQKYAAADTIYIAATAMTTLKEKKGIIATEKIIDEQTVYEWRESGANKITI